MYILLFYILQELHEIAHSNHKNGILSKKELQNALKIQKSLFSNGIPSCGADALRFTLVSHNIVGEIFHGRFHGTTQTNNI